MSTRCHILIKDEKNCNFEIKLYHHCDGYPDGVGHDLKELLDKEDEWRGEKIANDLVKGGVRVPRWSGEGTYPDMGYEITTCVHGDEEYAYIINCKDKTLTCYEMEFDDPIEETIKKNKVVEIP